MGAGNVIGVEPDIAAVGKLESQIIILKVVLADINVIAIRAYIMKGLALRDSLL